MPLARFVAWRAVTGRPSSDTKGGCDEGVDVTTEAEIVGYSPALTPPMCRAADVAAGTARTMSASPAMTSRIRFIETLP